MLGSSERDFFRDADPLGFIVFARNCETPEQLKALTTDLRAAVGRDDAPVLIDQEGGRVARLRPPHWRKAPAAEIFGAAYEIDPARALQATRANATLMGRELSALGIDVDCAPLLDLRFAGASDVIGDRALSGNPEIVAALGRAVCDGLLNADVLAVIKHLPGHGRGAVDSHVALPVVDTPRAELSTSDFAPFKALADAPLGMTAHIVYTDIDPDFPATMSKKLIAEVIRGEIGFDGFLISDDVSMEALDGDLEQRAAAAVAAGCDVALHCNGKLGEMQAIAAQLPTLTDAARQRWRRAQDTRAASVEDSLEDLTEAQMWGILEDILGDVSDAG